MLNNVSLQIFYMLISLSFPLLFYPVGSLVEAWVEF
jgi:hypothetical protein